MKTPPYLIGVALLFWGWQTGHWIAGGLTALVLEGARQLKWQWELTEDDYYRLSDLCSGLTLTVAIYLLISEEITNSAFVFLQWLPLLLFPLMAAQYLGWRDHIPYRCFFSVFRKRVKFNPPDLGLNISYPYLAVCLMATSAIKSQNYQFYTGFGLLMAWALWTARPRRFSVGIWALLLAIITGAGFAAQHGLHDLQGLLDGRLISWMAWGRKDLDPTASYTAIGKIGKIKLSGKIVLRLAMDGPTAPPALLRQASYTSYRSGAWHGAAREFASLTPDTNDVWTLVPDKIPRAAVSIAGYLKGGQGILALPHGTAQIENLPSQEMETNRLGVVRVVQGPGFINFLARHGPGRSMDSPPSTNDWEVPEREKAVFTQLAEELKLDGQPPATVLRIVDQYFQQNFHYSTYLTSDIKDPTGQQTPLGWFMLKHRAGHCEYFASATVLLLRAANLPARYATGYSVQEKTRGNHYVVRERHAHAWCLVYRPDKNVWEDFDTTPGSWNAIEENNASIFQSVSDGWSWLWFQFSQWRYGKANIRQYLIWLMLPLVAVLAWRVVFKKDRSLRKSADLASQAPSSFTGNDSEFYLIEKKLVAAGFNRDIGETPAEWVKRFATVAGVSWPALQPILELHNRYRFDPDGLDPFAREKLKNLACAWLVQEAKPSIIRP